jgi:hypothetical protein
MFRDPELTIGVYIPAAGNSRVVNVARHRPRNADHLRAADVFPHRRLPDARRLADFPQLAVENVLGEPEQLSASRHWKRAGNAAPARHCRNPSEAPSPPQTIGHDMAQASGDFAAAEGWYRKALEINESLGKRS